MINNVRQERERAKKGKGGGKHEKTTNDDKRRLFIHYILQLDSLSLSLSLSLSPFIPRHSSLVFTESVFQISLSLSLSLPPHFIHARAAHYSGLRIYFCK